MKMKGIELNDMIIIYTDGSTIGNGSKNARGGYAIVICEGEISQAPETYKLLDARAFQEQSTKDEIVTNNRMEMKAILWSLGAYGDLQPVVYSDSSYCVNSLTKWINGWRKDGWIRKNGGKLENKDLIIKYDKLLTRGMKIDLQHIKGHNNNLWNELADRLSTGKITIKELREKGIL